MSGHEFWSSARERRNHLYPSHEGAIFEPAKFKRLVKTAATRLEEINRTHPFEALAACGFSGVPLISALGYEMGCPIITVRKNGEMSVVASRFAEGALDVDSYIFVDDFVSSGRTFSWTCTKISEQTNALSSCRKPKPVAMFLYEHIPFYSEDRSRGYSIMSFTSGHDAIRLIVGADEIKQFAFYHEQYQYVQNMGQSWNLYKNEQLTMSF